MRIFITLTLLVFLVSNTLSSSHHQPAIGPSQITKLIDNLKYHEQQETYIETKIQQTVENLTESSIVFDLRTVGISERRAYQLGHRVLLNFGVFKMIRLLRQ